MIHCINVTRDAQSSSSNQLVSVLTDHSRSKVEQRGAFEKRGSSAESFWDQTTIIKLEI